MRKEEIKQRAYELYFQNGQQHGRDQQDWLRAKEQLKREFWQRMATYFIIAAIISFGFYVALDKSGVASKSLSWVIAMICFAVMFYLGVRPETRKTYDKMKINSDKEYEYFTTQLRYLDDKIFRTYALFITIATAITAGSLYLSESSHKTIIENVDLGFFTNWILFVVGLGSNLVIANNLRSWYEYRTRMESFEKVPPLGRFLWRLNEIGGCIGISVFVGVFFYLNPKESVPLTVALRLCILHFFLGILPLCGCTKLKR